MSLTPAVAESLRQALATVVVVPVTPLDADGNPDWVAYATLTRRLIDGGITVITPNGWPTSTPACRWPCWMRCAAMTSAKR
jgi:hypothetical protein